MKFFLCVIGMVLIIEGLPYFTFPDKIKSYLIMIYETPGRTLRILGLSAIIVGLFFVYLGRS